MEGTSATRTPHFWLRLIEMVTAVIAFAPIAAGAGYDRFAITVSAGACTLLLSITFIACHLKGNPKGKGLIPLICDCIVGALWISAASLLSDMIKWYDYFEGSLSDERARVIVATVFSWITSVLYIAHIVLDSKDLKAAKASAKPAGGPPTGAYASSV